MPYYDYRWANGHDVALANLSNVEDYLYPYTKPRRIPPRSQPVDPFPVETELMDQSVRGDGAISHLWLIVLPVAAYHFILTDKFSNGTVKSVSQTIYTRRHDLETYARYNCYLVQPSVKKGTLEYVRRGIVRVTFEMTGLEAI